MRDTIFGETAKDVFLSILAVLKRLTRIYLNGGSEYEWACVLVEQEVTDINTKIPITGHVMRKAIDGKWVYRQMTEEERDDFDAGRAW